MKPHTFGTIPFQAKLDLNWHFIIFLEHSIFAIYRGQWIKWFTQVLIDLIKCFAQFIKILFDNFLQNTKYAVPGVSVH